MLKKLKSLFIVEEGNEGEAKSNEQAAGKANPATKPQAKKPTIKVDTTPTQRGEGKPSEKFINRLLEALEENNLEGFDYLEYKQSLQSIDDMNMDEATMYKSSLAMAKTMGGTPDRLISSAQHYIGILEKEESKFQQALANQQSRVVSNKEQTIQQLEQSVQTKEQQIEQLKTEIAQAKEKLAAEKGTIDSEVAKIQATKSGFYAAYYIVVDQIKADLEKMQQHFTA